MDDSQPTSESLFRATKRQKIWRKRAGSEDLDSLENEFAPVSHDVKTPDDTDAAQLPKQNSTIAEILRRRKLGKAQKAGIAFTNSSTVKAQDVEAPTESGGEVVSSSDTAYGRFAPQTGQQVTDGSDKHMMAYVDFKMAQLQEGAFATQSNDPSRHATLQALLVGDGPRERRPASLGKLMEIDLGPDATLRNIARTEAATRRINTGEAEELENDPVGRKMRLGRDGKPFRPRRYRRNSNDVKRDKLVEEVMKESRLEVYEEPEITAADLGDEAADDRIAEEFRREFLNAVENKNVRKTQPGPPGPSKGTKNDDPMKGPKLGGSRSARAAMRAREEAAKKR